MSTSQLVRRLLAAGFQDYESYRELRRQILFRSDAAEIILADLEFRRKSITKLNAMQSLEISHLLMLLKHVAKPQYEPRVSSLLDWRLIVLDPACRTNKCLVVEILGAIGTEQTAWASKRFQVAVRSTVYSSVHWGNSHTPNPYKRDQFDCEQAIAACLGRKNPEPSSAA